MCVLLWGLMFISNAQAEQHQRIIQQEQQRQQDLRYRIEQQQKQQQIINIQPSVEIDKHAEGPCFNITIIDFDGADHMPSEIKHSLSAPFINHCIDLAKINQLLKAIGNWYFEQGYITSRAYITPQDLSSGQLLLTIIEGTIEAIELSDPDSRLNINTAFPSNQDKLLKLRDIEQGLEQINRLQSHQATMACLFIT